MFLTLQGEGANTGRVAVFCRFSRCNLWTGRERDRPTSICKFCDTDFIGIDGDGGGRYVTAADLADRAIAIWEESGCRSTDGAFIVCTGGEPLLQLDQDALAALHNRGFTVAIETNGTQPMPTGADWVCVSPKSTAPLRVTSGDELKLVYPQVDCPPARFELLSFRHFFLQPMDGPRTEVNTAAAIDYCLSHPRWRLSTQTHKMLGIR